MPRRPAFLSPEARSHAILASRAEQFFLGERRIHALGHTDDGRLLHVTFTRRQSDTKLRVISARDMSRRERSRYEQDT